MRQDRQDSQFIDKKNQFIIDCTDTQAKKYLLKKKAVQVPERRPEFRGAEARCPR